MSKKSKRKDKSIKQETVFAKEQSGKWTSEQEIQLIKKRASCLAYKWMHYRMARLKTLFATLLGFPLVIVAALATAAQYFAQIGDNCGSR